MKYETKQEATQAWVNGFNAIPLEFITESCKKAGSDFFDEVDVLATPEITCTDCGKEQDSRNMECEECEGDLPELATFVYELPMWGTVWTFNAKLDEAWAHENTDVLSACGFHVYEQDELGVFIGIDGAGYDFYEAHWIPLYEKRGLKWHEK